MDLISDSELQNIVHQVLQRALGGGNPNPPTTPEKSDPSHSSPQSLVGSQPSLNTGKTIALGADHGGFTLKETIKTTLEKEGYLVEDCGTYSMEAVDYPDFACAVAQKVSEGKVWRGIVIDGAGIGSCMVANKVPGVRAAMCYDHATAVNSREHNDANVLTLGAGLIGSNLATQIVHTWLQTDFAGGRHSRRVEKIMAIEKR
jgi:ribose 5-phosphate isomerase B